MRAFHRNSVYTPSVLSHFAIRPPNDAEDVAARKKKILSLPAHLERVGDLLAGECNALLHCGGALREACVPQPHPWGLNVIFQQLKGQYMSVRMLNYF